jgi:hypothetical protein
MSLEKLLNKNQYEHDLNFPLEKIHLLLKNLN